VEVAVLLHGVVCNQSTLPPLVNLWIRGAHGQDCVLSVYCFSLSLLFHYHFLIPCLSLKVLPKISCIQNTTARGPVQQIVHAYKSLMSAKTSHPLHSGIKKPYHSFLYTLLCLKSLKECLLSNTIFMYSNRDFFLSIGCVYVGVTGKHSSEI
jgi:hypothetical protein